MKYLVLFAILMMIPMSVAYATQHTILIMPGSSVPGCEIKDECFSPSEIYIEIGDSIIFEQNYSADSAWYPITSGSGKTGPGDWKLEGPYNEKGYFPFFDMVHPWMEGAVIVGIDEPIEQEDPQIKYNEKLQEIQKEQKKTELEKLKKANESLKERIDEKDQQIRDLQFKIKQLETKIHGLNQLLKEQVKVIYQWVKGN